MPRKLKRFKRRPNTETVFVGKRVGNPLKFKTIWEFLVSLDDVGRSRIAQAPKRGGGGERNE